MPEASAGAWSWQAPADASERFCRTSLGARALRSTMNVSSVSLTEREEGRY
jgi:hypothetical protein